MAQPRPSNDDVLDQPVAAQLEVDVDAVAAQRVVAVGVPVGVVQLAEVPRVLAVVQDHLLVQLAQIVASSEDLPHLAQRIDQASASSRVL